jgi:hypothetical protein
MGAGKAQPPTAIFAEVDTDNSLCRMPRKSNFCTNGDRLDCSSVDALQFPFLPLR